MNLSLTLITKPVKIILTRTRIDERTNTTRDHLLKYDKSVFDADFNDSEMSKPSEFNFNNDKLSCNYESTSLRKEEQAVS